MRCRRCEEEGEKKEEDSGEVKDKDKQNIVGKRKVEEKNGRSLTKTPLLQLAKKVPPNQWKIIVAGNL